MSKKSLVILALEPPLMGEGASRPKLLNQDYRGRGTDKSQGADFSPPDTELRPRYKITSISPLENLVIINATEESRYP